MSTSLNNKTGNTMTPYGDLPNNPYLAARIREADKKGLTEARAEAVMQSAGKLSYKEESVIENFERVAAKKTTTSKIGLRTLKADKEMAIHKRDQHMANAKSVNIAASIAGVAAGLLGGLLGLFAVVPAAIVVGGTLIAGGAAEAIINTYGNRK